MKKTSVVTVCCVNTGKVINTRRKVLEAVSKPTADITCDQALFFSRRCSQRKNERLIQLLVESSVKSPESGLFSDWSGNKRQFAQMFAHFVPASRLC